MEAYKYKIELQMSDTSGQPGKSPAPEAKPEGREFLDEGSKEDLLADTQVIRRSLESQLDKLREEKRWAEQCNTQLKIDLDKIKKRYNALESDFEAMVLEKELKIHSLELAQIRCQQLEPENVSQQQYITQLEARQSTLENTNAQLNRHLNDIVAEMSSFKDILLKNNKSRVGFFCRDDTVTLKKQLEGRDKEMHLLIEQEHETLNTVATLYEEKTRLQLRIVKMEKKWGAYALRLELDRHKGLLVAAQTEVDRLTQLHAETQAGEMRARELQIPKSTPANATVQASHLPAPAPAPVAVPVAVTPPVAEAVPKPEVVATSDAQDVEFGQPGQPLRQFDVCQKCRKMEVKRGSGHKSNFLACKSCQQKWHFNCLPLKCDVLAVARKKYKFPACRYCRVCGTKGEDLAICSECVYSYHRDCHDPPLAASSLGESQWKCHGCEFGTNNHNNYSASRIPLVRSSRHQPSRQNFSKNRRSSQQKQTQTQSQSPPQP
ncbi:uncharacterized protein LOC111081913 [Drosophila obscura]|uniref:uncharacterized protein LOC111081913 n=1 Tax=Drosophila obscura TaxID=7282 RepID=UPI001BB177B7|nr:uncharacterized protein LOC111081913 [Drosophila obscura]